MEPSSWQIQAAKTHLSEVVARAQAEGSRTIARHGRDRAVILSAEDYRELVAHKLDFKAFLLDGPKVDSWDIKRDMDVGRNIAV